MQMMSTRGFGWSLTATSERLDAGRLDTEILYQSTAPELKRKLKWALVYVIFATILWLIIIASFVYPPIHAEYLQKSACDKTPIWQYIGVSISIFHIILLWLYLAIYRSINIGILFFVHNIVNAEVAYYCMVRRYGYVLDTDCSENAGFVSNTVWDFGLYSILFHVILQWTFSCARSCFNKCRIGQRLYRYWGKLTVLLTFICIIWIICVYVYMSVDLQHGFKNHHEKGSGIIIVIICAFLATFGIFPFPFCREVTIQVIESWHCPCCYGKSVRIRKPYSETYGIDEEKRANLLVIGDTEMYTDNESDDDDYKL